MKVSGTVLLYAVAVCAVAFGIISGAGVSGRMSGFVSVHGGDRNVTGVVEMVGKTGKGLPAVTLALCGGGFAGERTIVYMRDTGVLSSSPLRPGDTLKVDVRVRKVENFTEDFDYDGYMAGKGIFFICFQNGEPSVVRTSMPEFRYRVRRDRDVCIAALRQWLSPLEPENSSLLLAFISGDKEDMSRDTLEDFRGSGMMHTLALSGLHAGIIYSILSFVFSVLGNFPASRKVRSAAVILCLWPYALLTGMGTSIFRAVVMATVYELAVIFEREKSPVNALALSAIIVTFADPSAPSTVSFRLSFGAMLGIALFYRPLTAAMPGFGAGEQEHSPAAVADAECLPPRRGVPGGRWLERTAGKEEKCPAENGRGSAVAAVRKPLRGLLGKIWNLCSLSISCQIVTMPLVYVTFGTFACWSLLANLICSPMVGAAMTLTPVCIVLRRVPWVGDTLFLLMDRLLDSLRFCVAVMAG